MRAALPLAFALVCAPAYAQHNLRERQWHRVLLLAWRWHMKRWLIAAALLAATTASAFGSASNYERSIANVLKSEGCEYTNDPHDPGGPTKCGITIYDVRLYLKRDATPSDVRRLTRAQAETIYRQRYAAVLRFDDLPMGLDYTILDYGVNSGAGRAARVLRRVLELPAGTQITDVVIAEVAKHDTEELIRAVNAERIAFLRSLKTWKYFGKGWGRRAASVLTISLSMNANPYGLLEGREPKPAFGPGKAIDPDEELQP